MKYYDSENHRLIFISNKSSPHYWDNHWNEDSNWGEVALKLKKLSGCNFTEKFLKPNDGIILDGGCGSGRKVASLVNNGYLAIGVDYAQKTVANLKKYMPELDIILGDIKELPFSKNIFSGYWSLGVIEHFWDGYGNILSEMIRVTKSGGYIFITFPYMSPLRKFKATLGLYKEWSGESTERFHQFALNHKKVIRDFEKNGLTLIKITPHDAMTGMKHEIPFLNHPLDKISKYTPHFKVAGYFETILNLVMSKIASHCVLLVFKK